ncbi:MAG: LamG-like jellyroll fold domain-containing protein, partial [bacterium]
MDFDGTDDYVAIARNLFSGLAVLTVSFWGQPRTTTDRVDFTQGTDNANRCGCGLAEDGNAYGFSQFNGFIAGFGYAPWSQLGVSQPIHIVAIYNSRGSDNAARSKVYLNGRQQTLTFVGSVSTSPISQGGTPFIGARPGPSTFSNGRIGEFA